MSVIFSGGIALPPQFGTGVDGNIVVTGTNVSIKDIYEKDIVIGVTTKRGVDKGLNYGIDTYNPKNNKYPQCISFTIEVGATLITSPWQRPFSSYSPPAGVARDDSNGIVWISCVFFKNKGIIDVDFMGGGGGRNEHTAYGGNGAGFGGGLGNSGWNPVNGGPSYGENIISTLNWEYIYGSGGGATRRMKYDGSRGGHGGGAVRIYAIFLDNSIGKIYSRGEQGDSGASTGDKSAGCSGGGGGGSGGTVYLESLNRIELGLNGVLALGGEGGAGGGSGSQYPNHGGGGGGGGNTTIGGVGNNSSIRYGGWGGRGSDGRVAIKCPGVIGTTNPFFYLIN